MNKLSRLPAPPCPKLTVTVIPKQRNLRLLRKFCVSEFRQNQEFHVINVHNDGLFPLTTTLPIERDGMRAARGVNAVALYRES